MRPFTDSRSERVLVADGSMAYSAVTQPSPESLRQRGTPTEAEAAHNTFVRPNSTSTEPAGWSCQPRVNRMGRSSSSARPSARVMRLSLDSAADRPNSHLFMVNSDQRHLGGHMARMGRCATWGGSQMHTRS